MQLLKTVPLLLLLIILYPVVSRAQDIHFSQFYETALLRNPALAGIFSGDYRIQGVYRNQWSSIAMPYQTGALSGEAKFPIGRKDDYLTGGLQLTYDVAGASHFQTTQALPVINYHKSLSAQRNMYLSIGFMGGFTQRQFNPAHLTFDNQYNNGAFDPTVPSGEHFEKYKYVYPDVAAGISFSSTFGQNINWFAGLAYYHFNYPKLTFMDNETIELSPKWEYNAGLSAPLNDYSKLIIEYNQLKQGRYSEVMAGALLGYAIRVPQGATPYMDMIYGGVFVRWDDAIIPVVKLELEQYEFGFSYDINVSKLAKASRGFGGFELSVAYKGFFNRPNSSLHALRCPKF